MHQHHTPRANTTRAIRNTPTRTSKKERSPTSGTSSIPTPNQMVLKKSGPACARTTIEPSPSCINDVASPPCINGMASPPCINGVESYSSIFVKQAKVDTMLKVETHSAHTPQQARVLTQSLSDPNYSSGLLNRRL